MPPKRKSGRKSAVAEKKAKFDAKVLLRWEWEITDGNWVVFSEDDNKMINAALDKGKASVMVKERGSESRKIMLNKMVQKNSSSGWEKRIRCSYKSDNDAVYQIFNWQDEMNNWCPYTAHATVAMATAQASGDSTVTVAIAGKKYLINLDKKEQTNDETGMKRRIQCVDSDAKEVKSEPEDERVNSGRKKEANSHKSVQSAKASKSASKSLAREIKEEKSIKVLVKKGQAPVDPECPKCSSSEVYVEGKDIYDAMLNQTNVQNNNNKFFILQLLKDDRGKSYHVWFRWGRVGYSGQNNLIPCGPDLETAKKTFCKKFLDKTKNSWCERKSFQKVAGKYDLVEIDYGKDANTETDHVDGVGTKEEDIPDSKLDVKVQDLIKLICDVKAMTDIVVEMKYDANKNPLGKLTKAQIKAGYAALKTIDSCVRKKDFSSKLTNACNEFYTRIPHDFGFKTPPIIRTQEEIKTKMNLLEALDDIEIAMKILNERVKDENPLDTHYRSLNCGLDPLKASDADYKMICDYLQNTHASTHTYYKMEVLDIFATERRDEAECFMKDMENRQLLWHGSRLTNWVGILSQGLRIAPPEAPVTGYMFGKGVYFADMSSKSANYCFPSKSNNIGLMLLCEVALGTVNELVAADYQASKLPAGKNSVLGKGRVGPDPKKIFTMPDGVQVPMGKSIDTGVVNPKGYTLNYNEFIVYDTKQIKLRYLIKIKFNFK